MRRAAVPVPAGRSEGGMKTIDEEIADFIDEVENGPIQKPALDVNAFLADASTRLKNFLAPNANDSVRIPIVEILRDCLSKHRT
jgi:hypothetical protein